MTEETFRIDVSDTVRRDSNLTPEQERDCEMVRDYILNVSGEFPAEEEFAALSRLRSDLEAAREESETRQGIIEREAIIVSDLNDEVERLESVVEDADALGEKHAREVERLRKELAEHRVSETMGEFVERLVSAEAEVERLRERLAEVEAALRGEQEGREYREYGTKEQV